jgi:hypothetical protein
MASLRPIGGTASGSTYDPSLFGYSVGAAPTRGQGAFGAVPGQIGVPPSTYTQTTNAIPSLGPAGNAAGTAIQNQIAGKLSPATLAALRDAAATYGVSTGVPGSQFQNYDWLQSLGLNTENQVNTGIGNYNKTLTTVAGTQTDPNLAASIADRNATYAAAPDPAAAASYAQGLFDKYLQSLKTPAGGTSSAGSTLPWYMQGDNFGASLGPGTWQTGPGTYRTPYQ